MAMKGRGRPLTTLKGFVGRVEDLQLPRDSEFFFRGHSNKDAYKLTPSAFRKRKGKEAEHVLFRELISTNPREFESDTSSLERLARMQHHSCPTRLLDVSSNPLVGLYFACGGSEKTHGEVIALRVKKEIVKFFDSDTVSCIANMARLTLPDKEQLIELDERDFSSNQTYKKLLHFIKEEKPYFEPKIIKDDLKRVVVVRPKLNNRRILAQAGAFILFGQVDQIDNRIIEGVEVVRIIIDKNSKSSIRKSLDSLNINEGSLYLDIDSYANHLKNQYGI
jgi:hypothetical protein